MFSKYDRTEQIVLFLLFFTELFSFKIGSFNTRYLVIIFWFSFGLIRCKHIQVYKYSFHFLKSLLFLIAYSLMIVLINGTGEFFIVLRLARAVVTCVTIYMFIVTTHFSKDQILDIVEFILLLHALCIIFEIVYPPLKIVIQPISQYEKEFMRLRAPGFLSGYDDAGLLLVTGVVIHYFRNKANNTSAFTIKSLIYVLAVIFASRISMLLMMLLLFYIIVKESRKGSFKSKALAGITLVIGGIIAILFWVLTTDVALSFRDDLFARFPILQKVYNGLLTSYTDYGTYRWQNASRHWRPEDIDFFQFLFGKGVWPGKSDIGYIKNIYATGIISLLFIVVTYLISIKKVKISLNKTSERSDYKKNNYYMYLLLVLLMLAMEAKISILFSSTSFELLSIVYFVEIIPNSSYHNYAKTISDSINLEKRVNGSFF